MFIIERELIDTTTKTEGALQKIEIIDEEGKRKSIRNIKLVLIELRIRNFLFFLT